MENSGEGLVLEVLEVLSARVEGEMVVVTEMEATNEWAFKPTRFVCQANLHVTKDVENAGGRCLMSRWW